MEKILWKKARKNPIIIEFRNVIPNRDLHGSTPYEEIKTREGTLRGYPQNDFVIRGVEGEIYPIEKKIFHKTYTILDGKKPDKPPVVGGMNYRFGVERNEIHKIYRVVLDVKTRDPTLVLMLPCQFTFSPSVLCKLMKKIENVKKEGYNPAV